MKLISTFYYLMNSSLNQISLLSGRPQDIVFKYNNVLTFEILAFVNSRGNSNRRFSSVLHKGMR